MKKNNYEKLTDENLLQKKSMLKGASIGLGIVVLLSLLFVIYLFLQNKFKTDSIAVFIPLLVLPISFIPILINFKLISEELKSRTL